MLKDEDSANICVHKTLTQKIVAKETSTNTKNKERNKVPLQNETTELYHTHIQNTPT
jgi:hypothetical protein